MDWLESGFPPYSQRKQVKKKEAMSTQEEVEQIRLGKDTFDWLMICWVADLSELIISFFNNASPLSWYDGMITE